LIDSGEMIYSQNPLLTLNVSNRVSVGAYRRVRIDCSAQSVWYKVGDVTVTATAGTAGESILSPAGDVEFTTGPLQTHVAIIEATASAKASVTVFG
jgi:hypothetical protein